MLFHKLCHEYIQLHKGLFWSFIIISSISYIVKILVTPMIYSNIMDLSSTNFITIIKQLCILWTFIGVIYIVKLRLENKLFPEFLSFVRQRLLRLYLEKNKTDFNEASVSSDITRIFEVTRYMKDIFSWTVQFILPMCILIVVINLYFLYKLPILGIINIGCNMSIIGYVYKTYPSLVDNSNRRETTYMDMVKKLDENFNNLLNIYLNNQTEQTLIKNEQIESEYTEIYKRQNGEVMNFTNTIKIANYVFAFICLYALYKYSKHNTDGDASKKQFVKILLIFTFYISTLENLAEDIPFYIMTMGNIKNAEPFLHDVTTVELRENYIQNYQGTITIDNISFKYKDSPIFTDFSMDVKKGERVGIIGQTGKGKSTLMKLILQFYKVDNGAIYLDGQNVNDINVDAIRHHINYVNQKTTLFNDTILNNMRYGNDATDDEVVALLTTYDLMRVFKSLDTVVEKNGTNISLGMQKVIFLVRGLLKKSTVYILDEPFSSIDPSTRASVLRMIDDCTTGKTLIVITHDSNGLDTLFDKVVEL
jgi:ABC-type multidrug transport system fused ATPase/permease subunit